MSDMLKLVIGGRAQREVYEVLKVVVEMLWGEGVHVGAEADMKGRKEGDCH
jgi:hypothetical protein